MTAQEVDDLVRRTIAAKVAGAKAIIAQVRERIAALSKIKCEDVINGAVCVLVKQLAASLKVRVSKVDAAIREIVAKGISRMREIFRMLKERLFPAMSDKGRYSIEVNRES